MNEVFVNKYIENLIKEITELNKTKLLLQTQLDIANKISSDLTEEIEKLKDQLDNQKKKIEVDTSKDNF